MAETPFPARLHVLMARAAPVALVIRRGPARHVAACLWDRASDTVRLGQWLKGRIYERRADISPDGRHWIYFAADHRPDTDTGGSWTALAEVPWLTARDLWAKGDCWNGGGGFADDRSYWLNGGHGALRRESGLRVVESPLGRQRNNECLGIYFPRLLRDGWEEVLWQADRAEFRRPLARGWVLHKIAEAGFPMPQGTAVYRDQHLLERADGEVLARPGWEWAERDGADVVFAERGCLWRQRVLDPARLSEPRLIHDFTPMRFEERAASG